MAMMEIFRPPTKVVYEIDMIEYAKKKKIHIDELWESFYAQVIEGNNYHKYCREVNLGFTASVQSDIIFDPDNREGWLGIHKPSNQYIDEFRVWTERGR